VYWGNLKDKQRSPTSGRSCTGAPWGEEKVRGGIEESCLVLDTQSRQRHKQLGSMISCGTEEEEEEKIRPGRSYGDGERRISRSIMRKESGRGYSRKLKKKIGEIAPNLNRADEARGRGRPGENRRTVKDHQEFTPDT